MTVFIGAVKKPNKISSLTSNQYYGGLNNRYDKRAKKLMKIGFKLNRELMAWHVRPYSEFTIKDLTSARMLIPNGFVMYADNRAFNDKIREVAGHLMEKIEANYSRRRSK
jgi:hypothetical protein